MSNIGRPKGKNNKEYVYSLRMDERTKTRLERSEEHTSELQSP